MKSLVKFLAQINALYLVALTAKEQAYYTRGPGHKDDGV